MSKTGQLVVKVKDGHMDKDDLERQIKTLLPGYAGYKFDYQGNHVYVKADPKDPQGKFELYLFTLFHNIK